tara:strand:+ start:526 stop:921 length:396 start_codon:yes stop_codon:yes gene_type:complete
MTFQNLFNNKKRTKKVKIKTTKKQIRDNVHPDNLFSVGYCDLQHLLRFENAFAYSCGVNGWSCDYYEFEHNNQKYVISTGYSPIGKRIDYKTTKTFDDLASQMNQMNSTTYEKRVNAYKNLLGYFLDKITK